MLITRPDAGKGLKAGGQKGTARMRWLNASRLNGYEFDEAPGDGEGQKHGILQSMGLVLDMMEQL